MNNKILNLYENLPPRTKIGPADIMQDCQTAAWYAAHDGHPRRYAIDEFKAAVNREIKAVIKGDIRRAGFDLYDTINGKPYVAAYGAYEHVLDGVVIIGGAPFLLWIQLKGEEDWQDYGAQLGMASVKKKDGSHLDRCIVLHYDNVDLRQSVVDYDEQVYREALAVVAGAESQEPEDGYTCPSCVFNDSCKHYAPGRPKDGPMVVLDRKTCRSCENYDNGHCRKHDVELNRTQELKACREYRLHPMFKEGTPEGLCDNALTTMTQKQFDTVKPAADAIKDVFGGEITGAS